MKNAARNKYVHYYELPLMWRENKYIIQGYRFSLKHSEMWKLIFAWHNETMNIWSHLAGVGIVLYIGLVQFPSTTLFSLMSNGDKLIMYLFLFAALGCLVSSSTWHTYSCFAHYPSRANFACIDYSGITLLITCSVIAIEYCALYNYPNLSLAFIIFTMACGIGGFAFNWSPYFDKPECRPLRIGFHWIIIFRLNCSFVSIVVLWSMACHVVYFTVVLQEFCMVFTRSRVLWWINSRKMEI